MSKYRVVKVNLKTGERVPNNNICDKKKHAETLADKMLAFSDESGIDYIVEELPVVAEKCPDCKGSGQILKAEHWVDICGIPVLINELEKCPECGGKGNLIYVRLPIEEGDWE